MTQNIHLDSSDIAKFMFIPFYHSRTQSWIGHSFLQGIEVMVLGFSSVDFVFDVDSLSYCIMFYFLLPILTCFPFPSLYTCIAFVHYTLCIKLVFVCFHPACLVLLCLFAGPCVFPVFLICFPRLYGLSSIFYCVVYLFFTCILDFRLQLSKCVSQGMSFHASPCNVSHLHSHLHSEPKSATPCSNDTLTGCIRLDKCHLQTAALGYQTRPT